MIQPENLGSSVDEFEVFEDGYWGPYTESDIRTDVVKAPGYSVPMRKVFGKLLTTAAIDTISETVLPRQWPPGTRFDLQDINTGTVVLIDFEDRFLSDFNINSTLQRDPQYAGHTSYMVNCDTTSLLRLGFGRSKSNSVSDISFGIEQPGTQLRYKRRVWLGIVIGGRDNSKKLYSLDTISKDVDDPFHQGAMDLTSKLHSKASIGQTTCAMHEVRNGKKRKIDPTYQRLRYVGCYEDSAENFSQEIAAIKDSSIIKGKIALRHLR